MQEVHLLDEIEVVKTRPGRAAVSAELVEPSWRAWPMQTAFPSGDPCTP